VSEEFLHCLLISEVFEVTPDLETFDVDVFVRTFNQHTDVVDCADVAFAYVDYNAGVRLLLKSHFTADIFRF
jgi:hypothetical protein